MVGQVEEAVEGCRACHQLITEMELDQHPTKEVYVIIEGTGTMIIDEESEVVGVGDVIAIPPNAKHKLITGEESSILFAALWWKQAD